MYIYYLACINSSDVKKAYFNSLIHVKCMYVYTCECVFNSLIHVKCMYVYTCESNTWSNICSTKFISVTTNRRHEKDHTHVCARVCLCASVCPRQVLACTASSAHRCSNGRKATSALKSTFMLGCSTAQSIWVQTKVFHGFRSGRPYIYIYNCWEHSWTITYIHICMHMQVLQANYTRIHTCVHPYGVP